MLRFKASGEEWGCSDGGHSLAVAQMMVDVVEAVSGWAWRGSRKGVSMEGEEEDKGEVI